MDYNDVEIELFPWKEKPEQRVEKIAFDRFAEIVENQSPEGNDLQIKLQFEHFLQSLSRWRYLATNDAVEAKELCTELSYPLALLAGDPITRERKLCNSHMSLKSPGRAVERHLTAWDSTEVKGFIIEMGQTCGFQAPYLLHQPTPTDREVELRCHKAE